MTIKRFFKVNSYDKFFNSTSNFNMKNLELFVKFYMNLPTRSRSQAKKLRLQK
jgi:hypothetical protein